MKRKLMPSGAGIKSLFTNHVEKLLVGVSVAVLLWFIYGLTGLQSLSANQQPERLQANAQQKAAEIEQSEPDADVAPVFQPVSPRAKPVEIQLADYAGATAWDLPLKAGYAKRSLPPLLPVESLRVSAGTGSIATTDQKIQEKRPGGGVPRDEDAASRQSGKTSNGRSRSGGTQEAGYVPRLNTDELKGKGFVVIVGKAPYKKQMDAFDKVLRLAEGGASENDTPEWRGVMVERATVESGAAAGDPNALQWKAVSMRELQQFMDMWPKTMDEVVAEEYTDSHLGAEASVEQIAAPLAPLVGENWGLRAAHPDFPLSRRMAEALDAASDPDEPMPRDAAVDETKSDERASDESAPPDRDANDEESAPRPRRSGERTVLGAKGPRSREADPNRTPDYKLFRFIDYSATPGQTYVYRVRLKLTNPNFGVATRYLENPELAKQEIVWTAWSETTPPVTVPKPAGVLASAMKEVAEKGKAKSVMPHLMLFTLDPKTGRQVGGEMLLDRGLLANVKLTGSWVDPTDNNLYELREPAEFKTDALVVDYQGGRTRGKPNEKTYEALAVLVRNADGQLAVRLEGDDAEAVNRFTLPPEPAEASTSESGKKPASGKTKGKDREAEIEPRRPNRGR